jgi:prefoldin subunit 5
MGEDATESLLLAQVERLIAMVEESNRRHERIEGRLDVLETQQNELRAALDGLSTKVDKRLQDTRPIWESVLSRLDVLEARSSGIETEVKQLRSETSSGFRGLDRKIGALGKNLIDMTANITELWERIEKLESQTPA